MNNAGTTEMGLGRRERLDNYEDPVRRGLDLVKRC